MTRSVTSYNCCPSKLLDDHFLCVSHSLCLTSSNVHSNRFSILQKGPKLLYLNTCIRGYPKGLRAGSDPRKPLVSIDEHFEKIEYRGVSSILFSIEVFSFVTVFLSKIFPIFFTSCTQVYGCGDKQIRDIQLDIKKWQVREAERQRTVKLTSTDWIDHPDRYLLELGGRPQYNNS